MANIFVSGGLGLIGVNYAKHCLQKGDNVVVLDSKARGQSCDHNANWLRTSLNGSGSRLIIQTGFVENQADVERALDQLGTIDAVVHTAAQVSIDVSMQLPLRDFTSNVIGTFTVLDAVRRRNPKARMVHMTSNKVLDISHWPVEIERKHYRWVNHRISPSEKDIWNYLKAKEPYGASKLSGLHFCHAYAVLYNMPVVIAIPSGMYGPRQYGRSSQGWLGWFIIANELGLPITIRGDGYQVRDMLHVLDVCTALDRMLDCADTYKGELFNIGGGPSNAVSLLEALDLIEEISGKKSVVTHAAVRPQDDKVFITNNERMMGLGWYPKMGIRRGVEDVHQWVLDNIEDIKLIY